MFYDPTEHRIKSFVTRAGRVTQAQARALQTAWPQFGVAYKKELFDWQALFGNVQPVVLEIGSGMGETTAAIAQAKPDINFIAIEVHAPGVGNLLKLIEENNLHNLRVMQHDAFEMVRDMLPLNSLAGVHIYFPDPWHKKKHHKRRLIQSQFVSLLCSRINTRGYLHCATDWQDYAEQMLAVLQQEPSLQNSAADYAPRPAWRPLTKFENRGLRLGHGVWDVVFQKIEQDTYLSREI